MKRHFLPLDVSLVRSTTFLLAMFVLIPGVIGQDYVRTFTATHVGMTHSSDLAGATELHFNIGHRFGEIGGGFYDMFGLDLATIRLGFDYGITDFLTVGIGRSTFEKTWDIYTKLAALRQSEEGSPVSLTGIAGWSVNTLKNIYPEDNEGFWPRSSIFLQFILARKQGIFSAQLSPIVLRNNYDYRLSEDHSVFALPVTGSLGITKRIAVTVQYIPVFNQPDYFEENPLSLGFDFDTGGHQFQLIFSNSTGMFEKAVLMNTNGSWLDGKIYFGFNLVRVFYLGNKDENL